MTKTAFCLLFFLSGMAVAQAPAAAQAADPAESLAVLSSEGVKGAPRSEHVRKLLHHVAVELNVARKELPGIVMLYVHRSDADTQHLPKVSVTTEHLRSSTVALYHVWIVDDVRDLATVQGLVMVMNENFDLKLEPLQMQERRDRVLRTVANIVDYRTLTDGK